MKGPQRAADLDMAPALLDDLGDEAQRNLHGGKRRQHRVAFLATQQTEDRNARLGVVGRPRVTSIVAIFSQMDVQHQVLREGVAEGEHDADAVATDASRDELLGHDGWHLSHAQRVVDPVPRSWMAQGDRRCLLLTDAARAGDSKFCSLLDANFSTTSWSSGFSTMTSRTHTPPTGAENCGSVTGGASLLFSVSLYHISPTASCENTTEPVTACGKAFKGQKYKVYGAVAPLATAKASSPSKPEPDIWTWNVRSSCSGLVISMSTAATFRTSDSNVSVPSAFGAPACTSRVYQRYWPLSGVKVTLPVYAPPSCGQTVRV
eukprot:scaffold343_cov245-Pinguiococcus_pyrenoidosus.AAC.26